MECNFENCPNFERLGKQFADRISELEAENEKLTERLIKLDHSYKNQIYELQELLQEIKAIAEEDVHIVGDEKLYYDSIEKILQVITKAESEG